MKDILIQYGVEVVVALVVALLGMFGAWLAKVMAKKIELSNIASAKDEVISAAQQTVLDLKQTVVDDLKEELEDLLRDILEDIRRHRQPFTKHASCCVFTFIDQTFHVLDDEDKQIVDILHVYILFIE